MPCAPPIVVVVGIGIRSNMLGGGNLRGSGGEGGRVCAEREKRFWFG